MSFLIFIVSAIVGAAATAWMQRPEASCQCKHCRVARGFGLAQDVSAATASHADSLVDSCGFECPSTAASRKPS